MKVLLFVLASLEQTANECKPGARSWSPSAPHLHHLTVAIVENNSILSSRSDNILTVSIHGVGREAL